MPWIFIYGTFLILTKKIDLVYIGDGLLSPVGLYFQNFLKKRTLLTIYGLDVIYNKFFYQKMISYFLPKIKDIVAISQATQEEAIKRGVSKNRCTVIPVGIDPSSVNNLDYFTSRKKIEDLYKIHLDNKTILFTIGRLVKRKGVFWFIDNVIEKLGDKYIYLIAGGGSEHERIESLIVEKKIENQVFLLSKITDEEKQLLFSASDIFLTPNITIKNDMEGFGIVNLEAGLYGVPVIASNIEGIKDAVANNITGFLLPEQNVDSYLKAIQNTNIFDKKNIQKYIFNNFSWESIYNQYMKSISKVVNYK